MQAKSSPKQRTTKAPYWAEMPDDELLDLRFCDLKIKLQDSWVQGCVEKLHHELASRNILVRPHCWLSDEWFSPDDIPGIAVPFYLAHPRLMKLEDSMMCEVEGGNKRWCMQLLRHETGHAIDTAFRLRRKKEWRRKFGSPAVPYPDSYTPKPRSKNYVLHLDWWYSQSHPTEDFAETFAVWLQPNSRWQVKYENWPALAKLQYVDSLMTEIAGKKPVVKSREQEGQLSTMKTTLREHYDARRETYGIDESATFDRGLKRIFSAEKSRLQADEKPVTAASFIHRMRSQLRRICARGTGEHPYAIDQMLQDMILRCRELNLKVYRPDKKEEIKLELAILLSVKTVNYFNKRHHRISM